MKGRMKRRFCIVLVCLAPFGLFPAASGGHEEAHSGTEETREPAVPPGTLNVGTAAPEFSLIDQDNKPVSLSDFAGRPRFVVFIYTHCKDVCPLILQNRRRLEADLVPIIGEGIVFLGITFDPKEDTPAVLKAFIKKTGVETRDLHLLTGSEETVNKVLRDYEINVVRETGTGRAVGHSAIGYAVDKDGVIREIFNFSS